MAKILAFAGSNSSTSLNHKLVKYTVSLIEGHDLKLLDMVNYPFPMFSEDYERENGYSDSLVGLKDDLAAADGIIISVNEHNSHPSAYFKNLIDWLSRVERKFLAEKPVLLMSTSGGKRGGASALNSIKDLLPRFGAEVVATFSLPSFNHTFEGDKGIIDDGHAEEHRSALAKFLTHL